MRTFDRTCKHVCGAAALLLSVLSSGAAFADGMPDGSPYYEPPLPTAPVLMNWSGFYIGGQLGGAWGNVDWTQDNANYFNTAGAVVVGRDSSFSPSGFMGGVIGGANIQSDRWVFGIELSFDGTSMSKSRSSNLFPATDTFKAELNWLTTITGRVGYTWNNWLVFARGGWAGGGIKETMTDAGAGVVASKDSFVDGWTVGGGFDVMAWPSFVVGLTYDYVDLNHGTQVLTCPNCGTGVGGGTPQLDSQTTFSTVMARASYFIPIDDY